MKFSEFLKNDDFSWFSLIWKRDFEIPCFFLISLAGHPDFNNIGNSKWYMRLVLACNTWWIPIQNIYFDIQFLIIDSKSNARGAAKIYALNENICSTRLWIRPKLYLRQFGEGVSFHLRQMDFTFAIGEMRKLMCLCASLRPEFRNQTQSHWIIDLGCTENITAIPQWVWCYIVYRKTLW